MPLTAKRARTANTPAKRISASRQYGQSAQTPQTPQPAAKVRTFAPGAAEPQPLASAGHTLERCPGCALTPWPECAACGAPTVYALEVAGVNGARGEQAHALTLCAACHTVLLEVRDPSAAEPLQYLPLTTLQTKQAQRPKNGRTAKQSAKQSQRPTQPQRPTQLPAKQPAQPAPRAPRKRTQRAKSSASATKGGAA